MPDKVPDPSPACPRCHHFEMKMKAESRPDRALADPYPGGIDQNKAQEILVKAFPKSYGQKT